MKKKFLTLLTLGTLAFTLTACGGKTTELPEDSKINENIDLEEVQEELNELGEEFDNITTESENKFTETDFYLDLVYGNIEPVYCSNRDFDTNNLVY